MDIVTPSVARVPLHTSNAINQRIRAGAKLARSLGLEVHAGHGLDYASAETISSLPEIAELNIGHFLIGEAVFTGLAQTVKAMRAAMDRGRVKMAV